MSNTISYPGPVLAMNSTVVNNDMGVLLVFTQECKLKYSFQDTNGIWQEWREIKTFQELEDVPEPGEMGYPQFPAFSAVPEKNGMRVYMQWFSLRQSVSGTYAGFSTLIDNIYSPPANPTWDADKVTGQTQVTKLMYSSVQSTLGSQIFLSSGGLGAASLVANYRKDINSKWESINSISYPNLAWAQYTKYTATPFLYCTTALYVVYCAQARFG